MIINTKYNTLLILFSLFAGFVFCTFDISAQTYGLKFQGHDVTLDKRTELDLTPDGFLKFQDEFEVSFDYKTTYIKPNSNVGFFGYVFRIVNENDENIDLLSTPTPNVGLNLVIGKSNTIIPVEYPVKHINNWIKLRIKFLLADDRLIFYTPDTFYVQENLGFKNQDSYKIIFGANDYKQFKNSDVPTMILKDIEISEKGNLKYKWLLNEKESNTVTDRIKGKKAKVINPSWLNNNHQNWQLAFDDESSGQQMVTADIENGRIFLVRAEELAIYSTRENSLERIKYINNPLFFGNGYRVIYSTLDKKIYCYLIDKESLFSLDTKTGEWNETGVSENFQTIYRHHNSYFNASDNSIYLLGGYGMHMYKNDIWKLELSTNNRQKLPSDSTVFSPRYLSGLGALNDTLYILGGYGSQTGNQLINPQSYFDLIAYSIKGGTLTKKFEIPRFFDDMVVGNTMWTNPDNRDYYALIFSKIKFDGNLQLIKGNLDSPKVDMVGNKIPFKFLDIRSDANLFYMTGQEKLYAYTSYASDSTTHFAIYSIDFPPNKALTETVDQKKEMISYRIFIVIAVLLVFGIVPWFYFRKRKLSRTSNEFDFVKEAQENVISAENNNAPFVEHPNYNLIFFGGFQVYSEHYEDITNKFSPLLKELFLLILLHSFKNNKGISSEKLTEILWFDKSEKSARNNRAVNIAKLKSFLEEVGSCELSKKTGYWKISFEGSQIRSDYFDFLNITSSRKNLTKQKVIQLIEISQKGGFLINSHYNWLDEFKAQVDDRIMDTLVEFGQKEDIKAEAEFIVHLADCIFNFDPVNEEAMILKCKAQYCMGKHSHAKATYDKFFKIYQAMYNQEYNKAFTGIINPSE